MKNTSGATLLRLAETRGHSRSQPDHAPGVWAVAVLLLAIAGTLPGVFGGPALGDHEAIVATCARNMRLTGDWLVPEFLNIPFIRKPPLAYWLVAGASYLFPNEPHTGLPVTTAAARLPSALAGLGTILLIWKLGAVMFSARVGLLAAALASSSVMFLLYSPNATVEMLLTFCCVWAYAHFWFGVNAKHPGRRAMHMLLFYVALGFGMLAKGPAPLPMVAVPLAVWWYTHRSLRILARSGPGAWREAMSSFVRELWPQTRRAFTQLWLLPGLVLFAAFFVPWMVVVARAEPHAWQEWNSQYLQRAQGDYLDSRDRSPFYYLPYVLGFLAPWVFALVEGAAAPWMKRYSRMHKPLLYCGLWALISLLIMSLEPFKKPYYILPALPALMLMMSLVLDRFLSLPPPPPRVGWSVVAGLAVALAAGVIVGAWQLRRGFPSVAVPLTMAAAIAAVALTGSAVLKMRGRGWACAGVIAAVTIALFQVVWQGYGRVLDNVDRAQKLAQALDEHKVPQDASVLWADGRPDARVGFYFGRQTGFLIPPAEIVTQILDRKQGKREIQEMAAARIGELLRSAEPVYLILERSNLEQLSRLRSISERLQSGAIHVLAAIERGGGSRKDWVVITNQRAPGSQAGPEAGLY